ncbi:MAG TPA: penicillin-binding transpeptidase domain-containing protein, partial [Arachnia sp.]|nr:penicillin-binding transpeptidase domain-containing protein [Arachnia sp.]
HPKLTSDSRLRHTHKEPRRGAINDNEGLAIVEEGTLYEVGIDKSTIDAGEWGASATALAKALGIDEKAYREKMEANGPKAFVIAGTIAQEDIPGAVAEIDGTLVREITAVVGPSDGLAAPLLGTVGAPTKEMIDKSEGTLSAQDRVGLSGLQARYDEFLRGVPQIKVDQVGRKVEGEAEQTFEEQTLFEQQASVSTAIETSLDRALQAKAEKVLSTQKGLATLVVLDIKTGGVLAAAQSPSGGTFPYATYGKYAPGSTFKAVTALAMLRDGLKPTSTVQCPANLKVGTYTFGNYSGYPSSSLGSIPLTDAFKYSCNTAFAGSDVDGAQLSDAAASLGVGTDYDAGFTSYFGTVAPGNAIDLAASKIGQGQVTMSPLGMAAVAASVGSGQTTIPWLVKDHEAKPKASLSESEATQLQTLMKATVDSGTGRSLQGVMMGAKTGTAQWGKKGKLETHAWMIAYNDEYAVSAFVEVGDSGGTTAAPLIVKLLG